MENPVAAKIAKDTVVIADVKDDASPFEKLNRTFFGGK
jgi:hypothetical protein